MWYGSLKDIWKGFLDVNGLPRRNSISILLLVKRVWGEGQKVCAVLLFEFWCLCILFCVTMYLLTLCLRDVDASVQGYTVFAKAVLAHSKDNLAGSMISLS